MNLSNKYNETCNWLVNAVLEKKYGKVPTKKELQENISIQGDGNKTEFYYDSVLIMSAILEQRSEAIYGEFWIPEEYLDEYIQERVNNWTK